MSIQLRRAFAVACTVPALLAVAACSGSVSVGGGGYDPDDVAKQVQEAQEKATPDFEVTGATCPDDSDPEEGATIDCSVTIEGVEAPYAVTFTEVTDDNVKFDIAPAQAIIATDKVVTYLQEQATDQGLEDVTADCGDAAVLVQEPDTTFTCTLMQGDQTQDVTMRVQDLEGTVAIDG